MNPLDKIRSELAELTEPEKAQFLPKFFRAVPGGYGEGDKFIGVSVPNQRMVARKFYKTLNIDQTSELLRSKIHEHRLTALFILVLKFQKAENNKVREEVVATYLANIEFVNNWDLVDSSAHKIVGPWLFDKPRKLLYELTESGHLWSQRIAVISTFYFISKGDFTDTLTISEKLINHPHDLIHKAVGWGLREVGKRNLQIELEFLKLHYKKMPRTMLRYAIEKFDEPLRQSILKGRY